MGIPVLFHERVPGLGSKGDLCLVNFSYYLIKDGSGPFIRVSDQVQFLQDKSVFQILWNVDGKPWLEAPIAIEGSTTNTVSPFVVLAA
jgi:HK97 family phage major capsid protein